MKIGKGMEKEAGPSNDDPRARTRKISAAESYFIQRQNNSIFASCCPDFTGATALRTIRDLGAGENRYGLHFLLVL